MTENFADVAETVDRLLSAQSLFRMAMERRRRRPDDTQLTRLQQFLLGVLSHHGPVPVSRLASLLEVGPTTISQFIRALEARGFVLRSFDPQDRRRHLVQITDAGRRTMAMVLAQRRRRMEEVLGRLTGEERADLIRLAERLAEVLGPAPEAPRGGV